MMQSQGNLFTRDDTFFGVCEGLGEDLRIPSNLLRAGFALALFFSPIGAVSVYFGLGLIVLASRLLIPAPRAGKAASAVVEFAPAPSQAQSHDVEEEPQLAAAA